MAFYVLVGECGWLSAGSILGLGLVVRLGLDHSFCVVGPSLSV